MTNLLALTLIIGVAGCAPDSRDPDPVCMPGEVTACACVGESMPGAQTCSDDGSEWSACRCCTPGARRGCACMTVGKFGQQDCSAEGQWGSCYACQ